MFAWHILESIATQGELRMSIIHFYHPFVKLYVYVKYKWFTGYKRLMHYHDRTGLIWISRFSKWDCIVTQVWKWLTCKYRNGALYICTHLPRSTLRFLFCRDACCCTMVPHSWVQRFYIFHVHVIIVIFSFTFTFIHLADTFIISCSRNNKIS